MVFSVKVPVLSEHSSVMPAISSMAVRRVTMAPCCASCRDPRASVVVLHASAGCFTSFVKRAGVVMSPVVLASNQVHLPTGAASLETLSHDSLVCRTERSAMPS